MGRAVKRTNLQGVLVARDHSLKSVDSRIEDISVQGKAVGSPRCIRRNCTTETIESYLFVRIVILENITHVSDYLQILVAIWVEVVQRTWLSGVAVGHSKVNRNSQVDLAAAKHIFQERVHALHFASSEFKVSLFGNLKVVRALFKGAKVYCVARANNFMLATRIESEKFKFDFPVNIVFAEVSSANLHLVPDKAASSCCLGL